MLVCEVGVGGVQQQRPLPLGTFTRLKVAFFVIPGIKGDTSKRH